MIVWWLMTPVSNISIDLLQTSLTWRHIIYFYWLGRKQLVTIINIGWSVLFGIPICMYIMCCYQPECFLNDHTGLSTWSTHHIYPQAIQEWPFCKRQRPFWECHHDISDDSKYPDESTFRHRCHVVAAPVFVACSLAQSPRDDSCGDSRPISCIPGAARPRRWSPHSAARFSSGSCTMTTINNLYNHYHYLTLLVEPYY